MHGASSRPLPVELWIVLISSSNDVRQQAWSAANLGSAPELWYPEFFLGFGHLDIVDCQVDDLSFQPL